MTERKNITIMGAGLVGSLLSLYLAKRGHKVDIYERRPDMRKNLLDGGRSINLALSDRGFRALRGIGIEEAVRKVAIPMHGRIMHDEQGNLTSQPYGKEGQAIYSVSRAGLNAALMDLSEPNPDISYHFNRQLLDLDLRGSKATLRNHETGETEHLETELLFGADGAFSMVRNAMQKTERYNYSQSYLEYGYKELTIPAADGGGWALEKNALHIWPRGNYMMIALPNIDGNLQVVPMGLQLLLENAIKHNTALDDQPLRIRLYLEGDDLVVQNNLQERRIREEDSTGMGLANLQARYGYLTDKPVQVLRTAETFTVKLPTLYLKS